MATAPRWKKSARESRAPKECATVRRGDAAALKDGKGPPQALDAWPACEEGCAALLHARELASSVPLALFREHA